MHELGRRVAALLRPGDLLVLSGGLGAGKTTFTQGLGDGLGVAGSIISPTFVIARVHESLADGPDLVHVDAYRLSGIDELDDLDLDADLDEAVTVIEWGSGLAEVLSADRLEIDIDREAVTITGVDPAAAGPPTGPDAGIDLDFDHDETRLVRMLPVGDRWSGVQLPVL
ncbi:tRNA (adenosine(37)-N6)-threonylcarbamoyltransferase complex ATPase subunit type 1 TsaE [Saxibacter everestensis]|uniref:tRNA threonylcarbamoyladenosine biosynthesis protein TsaE n=2 Tax=Saxibacter everestensis TaxID=2909229 RepID=A0ABY8QYL1_9MICO|nr:tRNA (adenosine(37)-N6)-threonylcarbamoyltransferase complex ATPase subunit type 1 TsaE [Brevibacteriaceae bacterium ZFBP1038]